ncbi:MAG: hypothetical protein FWD57_07150 [Polyangiaceae bacterium]|nr:hypothetical protein [Polyangiaceae bacterium]
MRRPYFLCHALTDDFDSFGSRRSVRQAARRCVRLLHVYRFGLKHSVRRYPPGTIGCDLSQLVYPGNITLYALARIENTSTTPATFTAYVMSIVRGISAKHGETTSNVYIHMVRPLD